jgi:uncharacterized protein YbjT (DUF2867 family)
MLVIDATGKVGSATVTGLLERGAYVRAYVRAYVGDPTRPATGCAWTPAANWT